MLRLKFILVVAIMFAFGYLLVPFYERICKAIGLRDPTGRMKSKPRRFDTTRLCASSLMPMSTNCR